MVLVLIGLKVWEGQKGCFFLKLNRKTSRPVVVFKRYTKHEYYDVISDSVWGFCSKVDQYWKSRLCCEVTIAEQAWAPL